MAAAISFAVGGIVNQTSGTVNAPGNLATVLSFLPFFLLLSLPQSVYRVYICIHLCRARARVCVCVCVCVLAQVRGMHERKCCEENVGEKRGMEWMFVRVGVACIKLTRFKRVLASSALMPSATLVVDEGKIY